jgi:hypothetical protein
VHATALTAHWQRGPELPDMVAPGFGPGAIPCPGRSMYVTRGDVLYGPAAGARTELPGGSERVVSASFGRFASKERHSAGSASAVASDPLRYDGPRPRSRGPFLVRPARVGTCRVVRTCPGSGKRENRAGRTTCSAPASGRAVRRRVRGPGTQGDPTCWQDGRPRRRGGAFPSMRPGRRWFRGRAGQ